jgi:hypothetical protein
LILGFVIFFDFLSIHLSRSHRLDLGFGGLAQIFFLGSLFLNLIFCPWILYCFGIELHVVSLFVFYLIISFTWLDHRVWFAGCFFVFFLNCPSFNFILRCWICLGFNFGFSYLFSIFLFQSYHLPCIFFMLS